MAGTATEYVSQSLAGVRSEFVVTPFSHEAMGMEMSSALVTSVWTSGTTTQNAARAYLYQTAQAITVTKFFWVNGSTTNGNTDIGIYNADASVKLGSSGSTGNSGTSAFQLANPASAFTVPANSRIWIAQSTDSASQTYLGFGLTVGILNLIGYKEQLSVWSSGLPSSLTLVDTTTGTVRFFGFMAQSVV